jgi:large subunit ribosomal protein L31
MKAKIHPKYFEKAKITCACGNTFEVGSTKEKIDVEVCSACHPVYTGKEREVKTGMVEKFKERQVRIEKMKSAKKARKKAKTKATKTVKKAKKK